MKGDILAEYFQLKARNIRVKKGLRIAIAWLILAISYLIMRITIPFFILKKIDAPVWIWVLFWIMAPVGLIVDQIEKSD